MQTNRGEAAGENSRASQPAALRQKRNSRWCLQSHGPFFFSWAIKTPGRSKLGQKHETNSEGPRSAQLTVVKSRVDDSPRHSQAQAELPDALEELGSHLTAPAAAPCSKTLLRIPPQEPSELSQPCPEPQTPAGSIAWGLLPPPQTRGSPLPRGSPQSQESPRPQGSPSRDPSPGSVPAAPPHPGNPSRAARSSPGAPTPRPRTPHAPPGLPLPAPS